MSSNQQKSSSGRSLRAKKKNSALESIKKAEFQAKHATVTIAMHVKATARKLSAFSDVPLQALPFHHAMLTDISARKKFSDVFDLILDTIDTEEFRSKYGENATFDLGRGILGWCGSRSEEDNPKRKLANKACKEFDSDIHWKEHIDKYAHKVVNEKKNQKYLLIDIGLAVYDEKKEDEYLGTQMEKLLKKRKRVPNTNINVVSPVIQKKKKRTDFFKAPKVLSVEIMQPVEFDSKKMEAKTGSVHPLGCLDIPFEKFVVLDIYENSCRNDGGADSDENVNEDDSLLDGIGQMEKGINDDKDDEVTQHIYESVKHMLGHHILKNVETNFRQYINKIGKLVSKTIFLIY